MRDGRRGGHDVFAECHTVTFRYCCSLQFYLWSQFLVQVAVPLSSSILGRLLRKTVSGWLPVAGILSDERIPVWFVCRVPHNLKRNAPIVIGLTLLRRDALMNRRHYRRRGNFTTNFSTFFTEVAPLVDDTMGRRLIYISDSPTDWEAIVGSAGIVSSPSL